MFYLEQEVMLVSLRSEFHFLKLNLHLFLFCLLQLFALLIFKFAEIHDSANRRNCGGRHLDKVQLL